MKSTDVLIIAEAGVNHNGSLIIARQLIDAAASAGADFIKFQTFKTELNISRSAAKADYQKVNTRNENDSQFDMVSKLELSFAGFRELNRYCKKTNIGFLSTGFDYPSIDLLDKIGVPFFKIPSGEIINMPYLRYIGQKKRPVILSTGMADMVEIKNALDILTGQGLSLDQITVLHCSTEYPTPLKDVNLRAMISIKETFKIKIGYSDHTRGIEVAIAAVAMGAQVIEKHFTLNRKMEGPDHRASIEPHELREMVRSIRNIEAAMGDGIKKPCYSEIKNIAVVRRSIHYSCEIEKGTIIDHHHLIMKRPGDGISPMYYDLVIGKTLKRKVRKDDKTNWEDFS